MFRSTLSIAQCPILLACSLVDPISAFAQATPPAKPTVQASSPDAWRLRLDPAVLIQTVGFWEGQQLSLQRIADEFPNAARRSTQLALQLELRYGAAIEAIHEHGRTLTDQWDSLFDASMDQAREVLTTQQLTNDDVTSFLDELDQRLNGIFPSPIGETILSFHPKYDRQPAAEFTDGLKREYRSDGSGKSRGLKLAIEHPASWKSTEGRRPHIVRVLKSKGGRGDASVLLQVREIPALASAEITEEDVDLMATPSALAEELPDALFIDHGTTTVAGQHCAWSHYIMTRETAGIQIKMLAWSLHLIYDQRYVNLQFSVGTGSMQGDAPISDRDLEVRFEKHEPLFKLMLVSFDIYNRYEDP